MIDPFLFGFPICFLRTESCYAFLMYILLACSLARSSTYPKQTNPTPYIEKLEIVPSLITPRP